MPKKSKILVLTEAYPSEHNIYAMRFVHTRLKEFVRTGFDITVLSFQSDTSYSFEGINVIPLSSFSHQDKYDLIISHAPNIRNHIKFLLSHGKCAKMVVFVIHGHEVLKTKNYYPEPYEFNKGKFYSIKSILRNTYDIIKCKLLAIYINKNLASKVKIIFVSNWMKNAFLENVNIKQTSLDKNSQVISNCIGIKFIEESYNPNTKKEADFVTIRPLDNPKYAIDTVMQIALSNPEHSFHIYGMGKFFDYHKPPKNVTVFKHYIQNEEIPALLTNYKAALMPTRLDSQGVSMCEMATFGIPMVVSDISICREMMEGFNNVAFVNNDSPVFYAKDFLKSVNPDSVIDKQKFSLENTVFKEIEYIESLI
jgi:glycosyltransferase involved in cell wall biosynthesis